MNLGLAIAGTLLSYVGNSIKDREISLYMRQRLQCGAVLRRIGPVIAVSALARFTFVFLFVSVCHPYLDEWTGTDNQRLSLSMVVVFLSAGLLCFGNELRRSLRRYTARHAKVAAVIGVGRFLQIWDKVCWDRILIELKEQSRIEVSSIAEDPAHRSHILLLFEEVRSDLVEALHGMRPSVSDTTVRMAACLTGDGLTRRVEFLAQAYGMPWVRKELTNLASGRSPRIEVPQEWTDSGRRVERRRSDPSSTILNPDLRKLMQGRRRGERALAEKMLQSMSHVTAEEPILQTG